MDDITLPDEDDDSILVRPMKGDGELEDVDFDKTSIDDDLSATPPLDPLSNAGNKVVVSFAKFVQLVANHSFIDIVDKNAEEEVIVSGNLLTDLANAHDKTKEKRMPLMFVAGLVIGIALTYIILK